MRPWHLGNTTVRSPFRLREGLVALSMSQLQGNLRGRRQEIALRKLLGEHGIVELGSDKTYSVGRKWRSALNKLGFLYPKIPSKSKCSQKDIGPVDMITPNGWRLIRAETVPAMQECFLRALVAHFIPSALERKYNFAVFSPLRHTLAVMLEIEKTTGDSYLNFIEMAIIVQLTNSEDDLEKVVAKIQFLRLEREQAENKRKFDQTVRDEAAKKHKYKAQTFYDYADTNFRYLKATGLVRSKGRGLSLMPEKHIFIEELAKDRSVPISDRSYFATLCSGAALPTDNKKVARVVFDDLVDQLAKRHIPYEIKDKKLDTPADIAIARHGIEDLLSKLNEDEYAERQAHEWKEILAFMDLIINRQHTKKLSNDEEIKVPKTEAPAYFEWILWRAFLAIDSLKNKSYEARRFKIDQDFLPVGTAPGNGPDLIFEFADFVVVVEVTLTTGSRQEAVEGEPVRRHVAELVSQYEAKTRKPVYGLFIANRIDSNTAETFRIGAWYFTDDNKIRLNIVPVTLRHFKDFFEALFKSSKNIDVSTIRDLLDQCCNLRASYEGPKWKLEIEKTFQNHILSLTS